MKDKMFMYFVNGIFVDKVYMFYVEGFGVNLEYFWRKFKVFFNLCKVVSYFIVN